MSQPFSFDNNIRTWREHHDKEGAGMDHAGQFRQVVAQHHALEHDRKPGGKVLIRGCSGQSVAQPQLGERFRLRRRPMS